MGFGEGNQTIKHKYKSNLKERENNWVLVAHACNSSYSGGRD
jgi:hypothetical protein